MDLRSDLAVPASSRLPVIMDSGGKPLRHEILLEDFMEVRTVRELASRTVEVAARGAARGRRPSSSGSHHGSHRDAGGPGEAISSG